MQLQMEPQFSYQMSAALSSTSLPGFGNRLGAQRAYDCPNVGAQPTVIDPFGWTVRAAKYEWVFAYRWPVIWQPEP
jgi:hypothetical protein